MDMVSLLDESISVWLVHILVGVTYVTLFHIIIECYENFGLWLIELSSGTKVTSVECLCVVDDLIQYFFNDVTYVTLIFSTSLSRE